VPETLNEMQGRDHVFLLSRSVSSKRDTCVALRYEILPLISEAIVQQR